ncbi:MAG: hypothetical protein IJ071_03830 [Ruminococcus sp.]|nr:hypothetical protein [Ruminococcus sp.]
MGFIIFGLLALAAGAFLLYGHKSRRASMTEYQGTVIGVREKMQKKGYLLVKAYCPVVKYDNGKREVTADHHSYDQLLGNFREGDLVTIFADPRLPKTFYFPEENGRACYEAVAAFIAGGALIALGIVFEILIG